MPSAARRKVQPRRSITSCRNRFAATLPPVARMQRAQGRKGSIAPSQSRSGVSPARRKSGTTQLPRSWSCVLSTVLAGSNGALPVAVSASIWRRMARISLASTPPTSSCSICRLMKAISSVRVMACDGRTSREGKSGARQNFPQPARLPCYICPAGQAARQPPGNQGRHPNNCSRVLSLCQPIEQASCYPSDRYPASAAAD